jgi:hypothetical protein
MNRDGSPARHQTHLEPTLKKRFIKNCWGNKIGIEFIFASKLFYSKYRNSFRHRSTQTLLVSHANRSAETPKFSAVENFQYAPIRILSTQHINYIYNIEKVTYCIPRFSNKQHHQISNCSVTFSSITRFYVKFVRKYRWQRFFKSLHLFCAFLIFTVYKVRHHDRTFDFDVRILICWTVVLSRIHFEVSSL